MSFFLFICGFISLSLFFFSLLFLSFSFHLFFFLHFFPSFYVSMFVYIFLSLSIFLSFTISSKLKCQCSHLPTSQVGTPKATIHARHHHKLAFQKPLLTFAIIISWCSKSWCSPCHLQNATYKTSIEMGRPEFDFLSSF
jgi:hypothetical protein